MTTYTARSFEKAQFAHHPDGRVAARINDHEYPWAGLNVGGARENFGDGEMARKGWVPVQEARPLTADVITDEMVERAREALRQHGIYGAILPAIIRNMLTAALTEPPSRPEGAEALEAVIGLNAGAWTNGADDVRELASLLASEGVRVVTEEER